jgi:hypothetical protein
LLNEEEEEGRKEEAGYLIDKLKLKLLKSTAALAMLHSHNMR